MSSIAPAAGSTDSGLAAEGARRRQSEHRAGSACRRRAASSASPPRFRRYRGWPRTATCRGRPRRGREGRRGRCSPPAPGARSSRGVFRAGGAQIRLDLRACLAHQVGRLASERLGLLLPHLGGAQAVGDLTQTLGDAGLLNSSRENGTDRGPAHPVFARAAVPRMPFTKPGASAPQ